ncbi:hypothetical protein A9Q91_01685 [Candidatus Gracilibacteria bacterium 28_42_T64]|nr:hypothetical protein A9Q91_01685 [Candidatus Gracilibacteria bacterium 28_42_T64]
MKNGTKKTLLTTSIIGLALLVNPVSAANLSFDEAFKNQILEEVKMELKDEVNGAEEINSISKELDELIKNGDLKNNLLTELKEEIAFLKNADFKNQLAQDLKSLEEINDGKKFYDVLNDVYEKLDNYYEEHDEEIEGEDDFEDYSYSFTNEKTDIIEALEEEVSYINDKKLKDVVVSTIQELKSINNEDTFFEKLDVTYDKLDEYFGEDDDFEDDNFEDEGEDYNFTEDKKDILKYLGDEINNLEDSTFKSDMLSNIQKLNAQNNEDDFFDTLDKVYESVDNYYEENGTSFNEDFDFEDIEDFDFDTEKKEIIQSITEEINSLDNEELKNELLVALEKIENETNPNNFFSKIDDIYDILDDSYDDFNDIDDEDEFFDDEK